MESVDDHLTGSEDYVLLATSGRTAPNGKPAEKEDEGVLPEGWEEKTTPGGKPYYLDHNTKTTSWEPPSASTVVAPAQLLPEVQLPTGWEQRLDRQNRVYFVDHNTRTTSWVGPVKDEGDTTRPLPKGWERRRTEDARARLYFINHNDRTTTWKYPKHLVESSQESGICLRDE
ncbi:MAG: hypothetical protein Q9201_004389 [Fulgogasparrea decipioides]